MKNQKELFIAITSPYKWGKGWMLSMEAWDKFNEHLFTIIKKIGHEGIINRYNVPEGKNETERSYFHPMELVVTFPEEVSESRIKEVYSIIKSNLSPENPIKFAKIFLKPERGGIISVVEL